MKITKNNNTVILLSKAKQSKAKQSKAKPVLYILTNNYFKFLFQKYFLTSINFLIKKFVICRDYCPPSLCVPLGLARRPMGTRLFIAKIIHSVWIASLSFAMTIKNNFAILNLVKSFLTLIKFIQGEKKMKLLKRFEKLFFISLVVIISVSCSGKSRELASALNKHKNDSGIENIRELIKNKDYEEAFYQSASSGYSDIVAGLVKFGADINAKSIDGATPLITLCRE